MQQPAHVDSSIYLFVGSVVHKQFPHLILIRYRILTEWDFIEVDPEHEIIDQNTVSQQALIRRAEDTEWTVVNWQLSLYGGRWLVDSLDIC